MIKYTVDPTTETNRRLQTNYSERAASYASLPWVQEIEQYQNLFSENALRNLDVVLDLGCGPGAICNYLRSLKTRPYYVGVDSCPEMLAHAQRNIFNLAGDFVLADLTKLRIESGHNSLGLILKNALHLLEGGLGSIESILANMNGTTLSAIFIQETVSPTTDAQDWVRGLFNLFDSSDRKRWWFQKGDIANMQLSNYTSLKRVAWHEQRISARSWLQSFGLEDHGVASGLEYIANAPATAIDDMKIELTGDGDALILRLQEQVEFQQNASDNTDKPCV